MKPLPFALTLIAALSLPVAFAQAQEADFPGLKKAMTPQQYEAAGVDKLSADERAALDEFIRRYVTSTSEKVATAAVDNAVKQKKATDPEVIESRLVGTFDGYTGRTKFTLENGQVWQQSQGDTYRCRPIESPPVIVTKAGWGHRMYILGGGAIRVSRVR